MHAPARGVTPAFVDFRGGAEVAPMLDALRRIDPHVVVVFRPEIVPPGTFAGVRAPVLPPRAPPRAGAGAAPQPGVQPRRAAQGRSWQRRPRDRLRPLRVGSR